MLKRHDIGDVDSSKVKIRELIDEANAIIQTHGKFNNYTFIDNSNIHETDLYDGLHYNEDGATKLAKNISRAIRRTVQQNSDRAYREQAECQTYPTCDCATRRLPAAESVADTTRSGQASDTSTSKGHGTELGARHAGGAPRANIGRLLAAQTT